MPGQVYTIRKKIFSLLHSNFHVYDEQGTVVLYCRMKAFRLREDIRIYTGEDMAHEVLTIRARQVFDFGATYDVRDPTNDELVGALRRKALKSVLRDEWTILSPQDEEIGFIQEDSMAMALARRILGMTIEIIGQMLPQTFHGMLHETKVLEFRRHFNPFVLKMDLDFTPDTGGLLDRRMGFAAGLLLSAVEGRQE